MPTTTPTQVFGDRTLQMSSSPRPLHRPELGQHLARAGIRPPSAQPEIAQSASIPVALTPHFQHLFSCLKELRLNYEKDADLVTLYGQKRLYLPDRNLPAHPPTDGFHGKSYFLKLETDSDIPKPLQALCGSHKLAENQTLSQETIQTIEEKLRFVAYRCRQGNPEYLEKIGLCAFEALECCDDRTAQFVSQMHGLAVIDELMASGAQNVKKDLFNLGVAYAKLDLLREVTIQAVSKNKDPDYKDVFSDELCQKEFDPKEVLEAVLLVEYELQERLLLPVKHARHRFGHLYGLSTQDITEIASVTEKKMLENYGDRVIASVCQWDPWVSYMESDPVFQLEVSRVRDELVERLDAITSDPDLSESDRLSRINQCREKFENVKSLTLFAETQGYFLNHRIDTFMSELPYLFSTTPTPRRPLRVDFYSRMASSTAASQPLVKSRAEMQLQAKQLDVSYLLGRMKDLLERDDGLSMPTVFELISSPDPQANLNLSDSAIDRFLAHAKMMRRLNVTLAVSEYALTGIEQVELWKPTDAGERCFMCVFNHGNGLLPSHHNRAVFLVQYPIVQKNLDGVLAGSGSSSSVRDIGKMLHALMAPSAFFAQGDPGHWTNLEILKTGDWKLASKLSIFYKAVLNYHKMKGVPPEKRAADCFYKAKMDALEAQLEWLSVEEKTISMDKVVDLVKSKVRDLYHSLFMRDASKNSTIKLRSLLPP